MIKFLAGVGATFMALATAAVVICCLGSGDKEYVDF